MQRPIMINVAMEDVEMNILKEKLVNLTKVEDKACTFFEGLLNDYPVVLCLTGVGMVNAAVATTVGINKYNPKAIIVQGTAGAHSNDIHRYDIVVSTDVVNINSIKTQERNARDGCDVLNWEIMNFKHGNDGLWPLEADISLVDAARNISRNYTKVNVVFGRVGSGDIWNREIDRIMMFNQKYNTLCEDMESFAVFQVAEKYDIPAISVRVISNNEILDESYDRLSGHDSQEFTINLIKEYIK